MFKGEHIFIEGYTGSSILSSKFTSENQPENPSELRKENLRTIVCNNLELTKQLESTELNEYCWGHPITTKIKHSISG